MEEGKKCRRKGKRADVRVVESECTPAAVTATAAAVGGRSFAAATKFGGETLVAAYPFDLHSGS